MKASQEDNWQVFALPANLTAKDGNEIRELFRQTMSEGSSGVVADAANLRFIDSTGIGILVGMLKEARAMGGDLHIQNLRGQPYKLFKQSNLDWVFTIKGDRDTIKPKEEEGMHVEAQSLTLEYEAVGDVGVLHLSGMICYPDGVRTFKEEALLAMAEKRKLLLNLEGLAFLDIQALNEFFNIYFILRTSDGDMRICHATGLVKSILEHFDESPLIPRYPRLREAMIDW